MNKEVIVPNLIPITRWSEFHKYPSERQIRWLVFTNQNNFLNCIVRIGKRILIDENKYFEWVQSENNKLKNN